MARRVAFRVPASTTNFGPGFDTLGAALSIENVVEAELGGGSPEISLVGRDAQRFGDHLAPMVDETLGAAFGPDAAKLAGLQLTFHNRVPIARGLGSSAAARLGVMAAGAALLDLPVSTARLINVTSGLEGHPDNAVPAAVGGFTVCAPTEHETPFALVQVDRRLSFVAAVPDYATFTSEARKVLPQDFTLADAVFNLNRSSLLVMLMAQGRYEEMGHLFEDRLHQPFRQKLVPPLFEVIDAACTAGAIGGYLSGSGSTVMAVTVRDPDAVAHAMAQAFLRAGSEVETMILHVDNTGLERLE